MLIKGQDIANIIPGNTLSNDGLPGKKFDYMLSNPPFGVEWKKIEKEVRREAESRGHDLADAGHDVGANPDQPAEHHPAHPRDLRRRGAHRRQLVRITYKFVRRHSQVSRALRLKSLPAV